MNPTDADTKLNTRVVFVATVALTGLMLLVGVACQPEACPVEQSPRIETTVLVEKCGVNVSTACKKNTPLFLTVSPRGETPISSELPVTQSGQNALSPEPLQIPQQLDTKYDRAARLLHALESTCGLDPACRTEKPDGEVGEYQATPIWRLDFYCIFGREARVNDAEMAADVADWLWWWDHEWRGGKASEEDLVRMYQKGPTQ